MAYDIFISYRRKGAGAGVAGEIQAKLENRGFKVFLDVDEIGSGRFPDQIKLAIEECRDFILVLAPGTLDRCVEEGDWVRREIEEAEQLGKNIVGVALPGFNMPSSDSLPSSMCDIPTRQVFLWTHEYRVASFEKIVENLVSTREKNKKNHRIRVALLSLALLAAIGISFFVFRNSLVESSNNEEKRVSPAQVEAARSFNSHVKKAQALTRDLPNAEEVKSNFQQYVSYKESFDKLMAGIAEYDSALLLKEEYGEAIVDSFDVNGNREVLSGIRKALLDGFITDVDAMLQVNYIEYAREDLKMARILALPADKPELDSLESVITKLSNN